MRKVYVLNDGGHNYTDAERFGDIEICTQGSLDKMAISQMYRELTDSLIDSHKDDYILVAGLTTLCMVGAAIMANLHGEVHMLIHKDGKYVPRDLMLENL